MGTAHSHSVSIPFSQMTTCPAKLGPATPNPKSEPAGNVLSDPIVNFEGLHVGELPVDAGCSFNDFASDNSGSVGFHHYVQVVNTAMVVYDKSGNVLAGPVGGKTFWSNVTCEGRHVGELTATMWLLRLDRLRASMRSRAVCGLQSLRCSS